MALAVIRSHARLFAETCANLEEAQTWVQTYRTNRTLLWYVIYDSFGDEFERGGPVDGEALDAMYVEHVLQSGIV